MQRILGLLRDTWWLWLGFLTVAMIGAIFVDWGFFGRNSDHDGLYHVLCVGSIRRTRKPAQVTNLFLLNTENCSANGGLNTEH